MRKYRGSAVGGSNQAIVEIFEQMRENALRGSMSDSQGPVLVIMDWNVGRGFATVVAAADGSASIYLSGGGGYIGGGQKHASICNAALAAVDCASKLAADFTPATATDLPEAGTVNFYLRKGDELLSTSAAEEKLRDGSDPLARLGNIMQAIITEYRKLAGG